MHGYSVDTVRKDVRIDSPFHNNGTKLTLDSALLHALEKIAGDFGTTRKGICDQYTARYASKFHGCLSHDDRDIRGNDLSHEMREAMIRDLALLG